MKLTKLLTENLDINDPNLVRLRAKKDQIQSYGKKPSNSDINRWYDAIDKLYKKLTDIRKLEQEIFSEMENDPDIELEGGPVADRYGIRLNKLDVTKQKVVNQINVYNDKITKYKKIFLSK